MSNESYEEPNGEARFWHRRYDEQHRTVHAMEDEIVRLRTAAGDGCEKKTIAQGRGTGRGHDLPRRRALMGVQNNGYRVEIWEIGPDLAATLLKGNTNNRSLTVRIKDQMKDAMQRGEWRLAPDAIHISKDKRRLFNGQKRLTAVAESGVQCRFLVLIGGGQDDQEISDTGQKRTFANQLQLRHEKNTNLIAAATANVWSYEQNGIPVAHYGNNRSPTIPQLFDTLDRHPLLRDIAEGSRRGVFCISPGLYTALRYLMTCADEEDATFFYERLSDGVALTPGSPILTLRNRLMSESQKENQGPTSAVIAAFVIRSWNAWIAGHDLNKLAWRPGGARPDRFPRIAGCPIPVRADVIEDD